MISNKDKLIFVHIPKCGGTSISSSLGLERDHGTIRMIEPLNFKTLYYYPLSYKDLLRKIRYQYINKKKLKNFSNQKYNEYFKFSFVRNPWSRAFSWFNNVMRDSTHQKNLKITKNLNFKDFLILFAGKGMLRSQTYWLQDFQGKIPLDFIGKFENINSDFECVCKRISKSNRKLEVKNIGPNLDYRDHYDATTKKIIEDVYHHEIKLFDYTFNE